MSIFAALLISAAAGVSAGGGGYGGGRYSTWIESSVQYEYSTKVWEKPCTTTSIWSEPAHTSYYTTTSISVIDSTHSVTAYVPCTTTLPPKIYTSVSVYTSPTTEIVTTTSYVYSTYTSLITITEVSTQNHTIVSVATETQLSSITLPAETFTLPGTTQTLPPSIVPTTVVETSIESTTIDNTVVQQTTVIDEETIVNTVTLLGTTQTLPPSIVPTTIVETSIESTTIDNTVEETIVNTVTLLGTTQTLPPLIVPTTIVETSIESTTIDNTVVQQTTVIDEETIVNTITIPAPPAVTITVPTTITIAPSVFGCTNSPSVPEANSLGCQGRGCSIEFNEGAAVHWVEKTDAPPLVTALTFIDEARSATCITTRCNTEVFNKYYKTSATACVRPPCPSNTIDCHCSLVVGPINLPDGSTTSVTQVGGSGWNLNLGPIQTARDVGRCGPGGNECVTATTQTLSTNLVYTGLVNSTVLGAQSTRYLLPGLPDYFPPGNPFGQCTTAILSTAGSDPRAALRKRDSGAASAPAANLPTTTPTETPTTQQSTAESQATVTLTGSPSATPAPSTASAPSTSGNTDSPTAPVQTESQPATASAPSTSGNTDSLTTPVQTESQPATASAPSTSGNTASLTTPVQTESQPATGPGSSISIPVGTSTEFPSSYSSSEGTVYLTETVYYSMILNDAQRSLLEGLAAIESGLATATNPGQYISSALGLNATSTASGSSTSTSTSQPQSTNVANAHNEPGYLLTLALMLFGLL
ncbi:hypothetical protein AC578_3502 [Pseudocercospora eumusae]|uniref:Ig-like domain-containing protein n=1 Tax=Pseudocercospora eumusae TaxID=321146 RepID=A0A139H9M1_9PEZI|nr:hypothetical protein AC578_3502 [Pseudocercospora eumusae]